MLGRQKVLIIVPAAICLALAVAYLITEPRLYTSTARLVVTRAGARPVGQNSDDNQSGNFLFTQREKLLSREVLSGALAMPIPDDKDGRKVKDLETFKDPEADRLALMRAWADVSVGAKNDVLSVSFQSPLKDDAATIANAIVESFIRFQSQPKRSSTQELLDAQIAEKGRTEESLARATADMAKLEQQFGVLSGNPENNVALRQLTRLSQQLQTAHAEMLQARTDYEEAAKVYRPVHRPSGDSQGGGTAAGFAAVEDEQTLRLQVAQIQTLLQERSGTYLPDHPTTVGLKAKLAQVGAAYADAVERRVKRTQAAEDELKDQVEKQQDAARLAGLAVVQYDRVKEDADRLRKQLEGCDARIRAIEMQRTAIAVDVDFFDRAQPAIRPSHPNPPTALGLALALGLGLGCGLGFLRDFMDDRLRSADEIKSALSMTVLGAVPQMPAGISASVAGMKVALDPAGEIAEAYRSVRTSVSLGAARDRSKTILVTSPTAGDGKSTAAANLATVMAQAGKKVLLIDADLRAPSLNNIFGIKDVRMGLSGLLGGQGTLERSIQSTSVEGLDLLACGPKPRNPAEMLNSPMFSELLELLAEEYDHIIVDSPPVMGPADARIIAASCDVTLLVLRADRSTRKLALLARDGLVSVGAHVIGVIVNGVTRGRENHFDRSYGLGHRPSEYNDAPDEEAVLNHG
ncbi:MAG: Tyrosine-protein kinase EpsD [Phycisphaerales bacterium]|nr:Tyrosine-protein kinase EpsD [Phycisphaerales bacterium]